MRLSFSYLHNMVDNEVRFIEAYEPVTDFEALNSCLLITTTMW